MTIRSEFVLLHCGKGIVMLPRCIVDSVTSLIISYIVLVRNALVLTMLESISGSDLSLEATEQRSKIEDLQHFKPGLLHLIDHVLKYRAMFST